MHWPTKLIFFSIIMMLIWIYLLRWSGKTKYARYFIIGNLVIYLFYIIALFKPLFIPEFGRGGGAFVSEMLIMIISPIHLALVYIAVLIFIKTEKIKWANNILTTVGLPVAMLFLGYLIAEQKNLEKNRKNQLLHKEFKKRQEAERIRNSKNVEEFESFLVKFYTNQSFQKSHTKLPLPVFFLNDSLQVDSVNHYYEYSWVPLLQDYKKIVLTYNSWKYLDIKSSEKVISQIENDFRVDYNFRFNDDWELFEIKKREK